MRILVADDHPLYLEAVRERLHRLLPGVEVREATSLSDGATWPVAPFDLALIDYHMPGVEDADGIAAAIARLAGTPVAVMSGVATPRDVERTIKAGARGFLPKTLTSEQFGAAVGALLGGGTYLPPEVLLHLVQVEDGAAAGAGGDNGAAPAVREAIAGLTERELDILVRVGSGLANKEIARELDLAEITVKLHVRRILRKTGTRNRSEAAVLASRAGLL